MLEAFGTAPANMFHIGSDKEQRRETLDESTWDRLFKAWLRAYKTKRIVQETVIVNYHVSMPENILRDIINKGLQDIVLEKKFQKRINTCRIPFLDRIFRVSVGYRFQRGNPQRVAVGFDGLNEYFIKATHALLQSLDQILQLSVKAEGLSSERRENLVRDWALQQQENSSLPFHQVIQDLSTNLQITDHDFLWKEVTRDLLTLMEDLAGTKRFVYLSEEDDKAAGELLDSLLSGTRSVSSLSYDEVMTFSQLTSAAEQAKEDGDERIIEEETEGVKQFLGVTECSEELENLLGGVWLSGVGDGFHEWKTKDLEKHGSFNPEEDYQAWCMDTNVWDYRKGNFRLDVSEIELELGSEVFSRKVYDILRDLNGGYNLQDSLDFSNVMSMFHIVLFALCRVGVDAKATTVFSSIGVTPNASFYYELLDMAKTVYQNQGCKGILEAVVKNWKIRRLVRSGSRNPEKEYLKWINREIPQKTVGTKRLASDLLISACSGERKPTSLSYEEVASLFREVYKAADKVGFYMDYDGMMKLMGISDDSSGFFRDLFVMAKESRRLDGGGASMNALYLDWRYGH